MINQEVDALKAIGVNPVRFLVVPALLGMVLGPAGADRVGGIVGLSARGCTSMSLDLGFLRLHGRCLLRAGPRRHPPRAPQAVVFAVLIVLIGVVNVIQGKAARPASAG